MRALIIFLMLILALPPVSGQIAIDSTPHTVSVNLVTDSSGNASEETRLIQGELLGLEYLNGNFTGGGNVTLLDDHGVQIDTYNLSSGNAYRLPGLKYASSSDAWSTYTLSSTLWLNMTEQQDNKTATVRIMYR